MCRTFRNNSLDVSLLDGRNVPIIRERSNTWPKGDKRAEFDEDSWLYDILDTEEIDFGDLE